MKTNAKEKCLKTLVEFDWPPGPPDRNKNHLNLWNKIGFNSPFLKWKTTSSALHAHDAAG